MAISDTITSMYDNTSNAYDMLSNGTDLTGINKNLENLSSTIFEAFLEALRNPDTLFNNLPKTSGSGSQITLNNTANVPMRINPNPTAISQTTYTGKNKLAYTLTQLQTINTSGTWNNNIYTYNGVIYTINNDLTISTSGSASSTSSLYINNSLSLDTDTNYILNGNPTGGAYNKYSIRLYTGTQYVSDVGAGKDFTFGSQDAIRINFYSGTSATGLTFSPMVRLASVSDSTYEPYVGGTASPNPSYPQDIHTISGNNSVVVDNDNYFNIEVATADNQFTKTNDTFISSSLNAYNVPKIKLNNPINIKNGQDYYISYDIKLDSGDLKNLNYYGRLSDSGALTKNTNYGSLVGSFTISNQYQRVMWKTTATYDFEANYLFMQTTNPLTTPQVISIKNIRIAKTQDNTYVPYQEPQTAPINLGEYELGTIGNYSNEFVRSGGENLFNPSVATTSCSVSNGVITITTNSTDLYIRGQYVYSDSNKFLTLPAGSYYISSTNPKVRVTMYGDMSGTAKSLDTLSTPPATYTGAVNFGGIRVRSTDSSSLQNVSFSIMLSTKNIDYVPYEKGWYYKQGIGKVVLDGSESWLYSNSRFVYYFGDTWGTSGENVRQQIISNYFRYASSGSDNGVGFIYGKNFYAYDNAYDNTTDFTNWLSTHNTIVYYLLATPTYTKITGELAEQLEQVNKGMLSYDGTTNISQVNNDLAFVITASALEDL